MMKILMTFFLCVGLLNAKNIQMPSAMFKTSGAVVDMKVADKKLYVATAAGKVDIFDLESQKLLKSIEIDKIKDFMGDTINAKIFSVDEMGGDILILAQAQQGYRRLYINHNGVNELVIDTDMALSIAKAKFLNEHTILLALLSDELISFDIVKKTINWRMQAGGSRFSNFALSEDKTQVALTDESGEVQIVDTKNGLHVMTLNGQNVDNVFSVDYKNGVVATAGQDRRAAIYDTKTGSAYYKQSDFLVYSVGLSPSANIAAYSSDENNNITLFNTNTKDVLGVFGGTKMTLSKILFINEKEFLASSDDSVINLYRVK